MGWEPRPPAAAERVEYSPSSCSRGLLIQPSSLHRHVAASSVAVSPSLPPSPSSVPHPQASDKHQPRPGVCSPSSRGPERPAGRRREEEESPVHRASSGADECRRFSHPRRPGMHKTSERYTDRKAAMLFASHVAPSWPTTDSRHRLVVLLTDWPTVHAVTASRPGRCVPPPPRDAHQRKPAQPPWRGKCLLTSRPSPHCICKRGSVLTCMPAYLLLWPCKHVPRLWTGN